MTTFPYASFAVLPGSPAPDAFSVTPSDGTAFTTAARWLYVGGNGDVTLVTLAGNTVLFKNVQIGQVLPIACQQVKATGTTATLILGLI